MRYLVVANQTLNTPQMEGTIRQRIAEGGTHFHFVVPATQPHDQNEPVAGDAIGIAKDRLNEAMERFHGLDVHVSGEVGTAEPLLAISNALGANDFGAVIISTLPLGVSRWLRRDLPSRVRRAFPSVLVDHVTVEMANT